MSAWAVFSLLGFYPDCPGEPAYSVIGPAFEEVELDGRLRLRAKDRIRRHRLSHSEFIKHYAIQD